MNHNTLHLFGLNKFHNSVNERDEKKLTAYEETSRKQNNGILDHFRRRGGTWTAYEIHPYFSEQMILTSVRRALTDLCKDGYLEVVGKRKGELGRDCLVYKVKS